MSFPTDAGAFTTRDWLDGDITGRVRFAVVGLGGWARNFALPSLDEAEFCDVAAVASSSEAKAANAADAYDASAAITYEDFHAGVAADEYDAVYVATPHATHLDFTRTAAGLDKHVLCEKPMEATAARAEQMRAVCESAGVTLAIAYRMQVDPVMRRLREFVAAGGLGQPVQVHGGFSERALDLHGADQWRFDPDLAGGGALYEIGVYPLNTTRFLLGLDPVTVFGTTASPDAAWDDAIDEHVAFQVSLPGAVTGSFTASSNATPDDWLQLIGTEAVVSIDSAFSELHRRTVTIESDDSRLSYTAPNINELTELFEYFATRLLTGEPLEPNASDGLTDMRVIEAVSESARTDRVVSL